MLRDRRYYHNHEERLSLDKAVSYLLEECRMVLPGIQALFGFQLIAVFTDGFDTKLDRTDQLLHVVALLLVALAAALIMAPAAFHRIVSPQAVSKPLLRLFSRLLMWGMLPLSLGICLDIHLIASIVLPGWWPEVVMMVVFLALAVLWFLLPQWIRIRRKEVWAHEH